MMTTATLRSQILSDIESFRAGKMSRAEARALAAMTRNVLETVKIELTAATIKITDLQPVTLDAGAEQAVRRAA